MIDQSGEVLTNRNAPNGPEPILKVIGGLPPGTPAAFEVCYGTSWLVQLLEDYGFDPHLVHPSRCKTIASARLKNDKAGAAILAQLPRADLLLEAWIPGLARRAGVARGVPRAGRGSPGPDRRAAGPDRPAGPGDPPAGPVRPAGQGAHPAARHRPVHCAGHRGRGR